MVIYSSDTTGTYQETVERIAANRSESVVTDLDRAVESEEPVVVVGSPSSLTERELLLLQRRQLENGPGSGAFGIVTGYTPEHAEDLYFDQQEVDGKDTLAFRNAPDRMPSFSDTNVLADREVTADAIEEFTSQRLRSFEIRAGGHPIHITLSDGFICGFPESQSVEEYAGIQPFCVSDGKRDCPLDDDLVLADDIDAAHVFLMSCASMIDNGTADLPVHVGMGLLQGAESLVGSYRITASRSHELLLHHSLLEAGYSVNERCYVLNKNAHRNAIESHPYVPFGRPTARVANPHESQFEVDIETDKGLRARITDLDAYVVDFRIPATDLPAHPDRLYVRNQTDTDDPVYFTAFETVEGDARVLVYSGGRMQLDEMELEISDRTSRYVERQLAIESGRRVKRTAEMGFLTTGATEQAEQLENQLRTLPERAVDEEFDADAHVDVEQQLDSIHGHVNNVRDELVSSIRKSSFLPYHYAKNVVDEDTYVGDELCTSCGERPVFVKQVAGWSVDAKRLLGKCPQCGLLFDVPASERETQPTYPLVRTDLDADGDRMQPLEIEFENSTDVPMHATFVPLVLHADNEENAFFEPERYDAVLSPGESHTAEFMLDTNLLRHDVYYVLGLVVGNLDVYGGHHTATFGDQAGYFPRKLR